MSSVPGGFFFLILALHSFQEKKKKVCFFWGSWAFYVFANRLPGMVSTFRGCVTIDPRGGKGSAQMGSWARTTVSVTYGVGTHPQGG